MSWIRDLLVTPECLGCSLLGTGLCPECQKELRSFTSKSVGMSVLCVSEYDGWLRERLIDFKNGAAHLARPLAQLMSPLIPGDAIVVPIPTTQQKIRSRKFDTIGLLAQELARLESGRRFLPVLKLARPVRDQVGLSEAARRTNLSHALTATHNIAHSVFVIDDVLTTGATLGEARRALVIAGARQVSAAVLCGSPKRR